ncbi:Uncharacterised protein [Enterobacter kobei]|nr:Uncharacterised protein [Enterobacter kobei]
MINIISLLKGFGSSNSSLLLRYQVLPHLKSLADMVSQKVFQGPITTPYPTTSRWQYLLSKDLGLIYPY